MKHIAVRITLILLLSCSAVAQIQAAQNKPVELSADVIEYDSVNGIMTAQGNVQMVQDNAVMTGGIAKYNSKTKEAHVTGGVRVIKEGATLLAEEVRSYADNHMVATGNPVLTKGDSKLIGPKIDYYSDKQHAIVTGGAKLTMPDSVMTANQIETFFNEDKVVAEGNVHVVSQPRNFDSTSDQAIYYGNKGEEGKTVLTGNARAVQDGNVLTGNTITLFLDRKAIDVQGRSKLVITPQ
ncbi:MAG: LPS export ABC transporter periplasmic protein LptC [Sporomusaceae bacterium]|nr:LPS export ABC transporter periplasmic protein LptC [Sporomusaceae bacterium]